MTKGHDGKVGPSPETPFNLPELVEPPESLGTPRFSLA